MIDLLITYLPFSRAGDLKEFFLKNYEFLKPAHAMVFVDNIREISTDGWKKESVMSMAPFAEIITGDWNDPSLCLMEILLKLKNTNFSRALIVDSDNLLPHDFQELDSMMVSEGFGYYSLAEYNIDINKPMYKGRSRFIKKVGNLEVYCYNIAGIRRGIFFLGPKQAIALSKEFVSMLNVSVIKNVFDSMRSVPSQLRHAISDETTLGVVLYFSGVKCTPWTIASYHAFGARLDYDPLYVAPAHAIFARQLLKKIRHRRVLWYYLRYKLSLILRSLKV
ncbi:MAG: hypothetical protein QXV32_05990 [Conexivisphaerales archaeon]